MESKLAASQPPRRDCASSQLDHNLPAKRRQCRKQHAAMACSNQHAASDTKKNLTKMRSFRAVTFPEPNLSLLIMYTSRFVATSLRASLSVCSSNKVSENRERTTLLCLGVCCSTIGYSSIGPITNWTFANCVKE